MTENALFMRRKQKKIGFEKNLGPKKFWVKKNWVQKKIGPKKIWVHNNCRSRKILGLEKFLVQKNLWSKIIWGPKKFRVKKNLGFKKILGWKKFWVQKNLWSKIILGPVHYQWQIIPFPTPSRYPPDTLQTTSRHCPKPTVHCLLLSNTYKHINTLV